MARSHPWQSIDEAEFIFTSCLANPTRVESPSHEADNGRHRPVAATVEASVPNSGEGDAWTDLPGQRRRRARVASVDNGRRGRRQGPEDLEDQAEGKVECARG